MIEHYVWKKLQIIKWRSLLPRLVIYPNTLAWIPSLPTRNLSKRQVCLWYNIKNNVSLQGKWTGCLQPIYKSLGFSEPVVSLVLWNLLHVQKLTCILWKFRLQEQENDCTLGATIAICSKLSFVWAQNLLFAAIKCLQTSLSACK